MAVERDRTALDMMRKKLDAMMQTEEVQSLNEGRKKVLIAPCEAVMLEEQVQEKAQLAQELAAARERRRVLASRLVASAPGVPRHTPDVQALLKEIAELELVDKPAVPLIPGGRLSPRREKRVLLANTFLHSPKDVLPGGRSASATVSRQAAELETARNAAKAAEESERKFKQMRAELRSEVLEEVFGVDDPSFRGRRSNSGGSSGAGVQIDLIGEVDFFQPQYNILSSNVSLDVLLDHFRPGLLWGDLCSRASPLRLESNPISQKEGKRSISCRAKKISKISESVQINYDNVDETPLPPPQVPEVVLPLRDPIPRDNMLKVALNELELLNEDEERAQASLRSQAESFLLLENSHARRSLERQVSDPVSHVVPVVKAAIKPLPILEAPRFFAEPAAEPAVETQPEQSTEAVLSTLRQRAKRNMQHIAHLRSLANN